MATYRYLIGDLLAGDIYLELPFFGMYFTRRLNKAGSATFSFILGSSDSGYNDAEILENTKPGKSVLYIERNGSLVWGGIVWSRTYESQGNTLNFTAQTFESFFYKQYLEDDFNRTEVDQRQILADLIATLQAKPYANLNIVIPTSFNTSNAITRTVNYYPYQMWSFGKTIENMIEYDEGFDYTIDVSYDGSGNPIKQLLTDNVLGQSVDTTQAVFDYPGNIKNYYFPDSASMAAVSVLGFGDGEEADMLRSKYVNVDLLAEGYPDLQMTLSGRDITVQETLASQTYAKAIASRIPINIPTIVVNPELEPTFGSWFLGDYIKVHIEDVRFPNGTDILARIIGFNAKPPSSENQEELTLIIAGDEDY